MCSGEFSKGFLELNKDFHREDIIIITLSALFAPDTGQYLHEKQLFLTNILRNLPLQVEDHTSTMSAWDIFSYPNQINVQINACKLT